MENIELRQKSDQSTDVEKPKYPWHLFIRTVVLLNAFLVLGIVEGVIGPTLLDLKDFMGVSLGSISFIIMVSSIGSMVGCFLSGYVMDKLVKLQYLMLAGSVIIFAGPFSLFPFCPNIVTIYVCSFFKGFGSGFLDTGGNSLLLGIWAGRDSGPYMHALHFTFGLGAFLAPLLARPFLINEESEGGHGERNVTVDVSLTAPLASHHNLSSLSPISPESVWTIRALYPLIGGYALLSSFGLLIFFIKDVRKARTNSRTPDKEDFPMRVESKMSEKMKVLLVSLMAAMFFIYVGMEVAFGTFISIFAVKSSLKFTRPEGSTVAAVFWGTFAATRGLAILLAMIARPGLVMWTSVCLCLLASALLSALGSSSPALLFTGTGLLGVGMASIFATGFLWTEQRITVTSKISAVFIISSSLGAKVFPVLVGQLVESSPMTLHYLTLAIVTGCAGLFGAANIIVRHVK